MDADVRKEIYPQIKTDYGDVQKEIIKIFYLLFRKSP